MSNNQNYNQENKKKSSNPLIGILKVVGTIGAAVVSACFASEGAHRVSENNSREKAQQVALNRNNKGE